MPNLDLPEAFLSRMQRLLGDEYEAFLRAYSDPPVTGLRVNTLKISADAFLAISPYPLSPISWCHTGFTLPTGAQPGRHPFHAAGLYYLQDPSAMAVAERLGPRPGERVLDLSAAPGGKATHIAARMENQGLLVANEIHPGRAWELAQNLERCGVTNAVVLNETPERLADHFGPFFDRVLLDAPCSGEGMFRKSETARAEWTPRLVQSCALRQSIILESASQMVRPGGVLAYTTCTFAPEENEAVIGSFLRGNPGYELVGSDPVPGFSTGRGDWLADGATDEISYERAIRLWPHKGAAEGHFIAILQRKDQAVGAEGPAPHKIHKSKLPPDLQTAFLKFWQETLLLPAPPGHIIRHGSYLYRIPEDLPDLASLRIIHPGWWLGEMKKERFEPAHALAMGLKAGDARREVLLPVRDAPAYLRGETLSNEGEPGWVIVLVGADGKSTPLGWGKRVGNTVKNAYPRGLRWFDYRA